MSKRWTNVNETEEYCKSVTTRLYRLYRGYRELLLQPTLSQTHERPAHEGVSPAQMAIALGVRECRTVTVASRFWRSRDAGRPTMLERPMTTARLPSMGIL